MVFISLDTHLLICELIMMLIGLVILLIDILLLVIAYFLVTRWYLGAVRSKQSYLALVLKLNIEPLSILLRNFFGCIGYFKIWEFHSRLLNHFIVIITTIQTAHNDVFHERTKHIENDCHFIRHHILQGTIHLISVSSTDQTAEIIISKWLLQNDYFEIKISNFFTQNWSIFKCYITISNITISKWPFQSVNPNYHKILILPLLNN